jgi:hypothetical protein
VSDGSNVTPLRSVSGGVPSNSQLVLEALKLVARMPDVTEVVIVVSDGADVTEIVSSHSDQLHNLGKLARGMHVMNNYEPVDTDSPEQDDS